MIDDQTFLEMYYAASNYADQLTEENIKDANLVQKTTAFGILYDKERLERDKSTVNIAHAVAIERQAELEQLAVLAGQKRITEACDIPEAEVVDDGVSEYVLE